MNMKEQPFTPPQVGDEITVPLLESGVMKDVWVRVAAVYTEPPLTGIMRVQIVSNPSVFTHVENFGRPVQPNAARRLSTGGGR
jgi:hypothetical protein